MRRVSAFFSLLALACGGDSCSCGDVSLAELVAREGPVERDFARAIERWIAADVGARFTTGDAVRTGDRASARLQLSDGGGLDLKSGTLVRFLAEAPGVKTPRVRIESGVAEVEAGADSLSIETKGGAARLKGRSRARIAFDADGNARLEVLLGAAQIEGADTATQGAIVSFGPARPTPDAGAPETAPPIATVESSALAIHGVDEPVPIAIRFGERCPGEGIVRVFDESGAVLLEARGTGEAIVAAPPAAKRFEVVCAEDPSRTVMQGNLRFADDDAAPLSTSVQELNADGKRREIAYAEKSPPISFRWTQAPAVDAFELVLSKKGAAPRRFPLDRAKHQLNAGAIGEGDYEWWFEVAESDRASPKSRIGVRGDKEAIGEVNVKAVKEGVALLSGRVISGAKVSVGDREVPLKKGSFSLEIATSTASDFVSVRVDHPERGTHLFVKRVRGSP